MNYQRLIGIIWFPLVFVSSGFGQDVIKLDINIPDSFAEPRAVMFKQLHLTSRVSIKYSDLNPRIEQMIGFFENSGYPFVQVSLDSVNPEPSGISGVLSVSPGEFVSIDTLINRTGFRISSRILSRLVNIRPGDRYRESAVKEASRRLAQVPYMSQVRPPEIGFHPGKAAVYLYPEKASSNRFDGWIGLSPDLRTGGKLAFSGALKLDLNNILGQGENWKFDWHRNQDGSQKLDLSAQVPYLAGLPVGLQGHFDLYRQDTSYLNLNWDLGLPYHFSINHLLNVFVRHRESSVISPSKDIQNSSRQPFTSFLSGLKWSLNQLDNPVNPYRGYAWSVEVSTGRKNIPDSASMQQSEIAANITWFQPLARNFTCAVMVQSGYRKSPKTYENEQYRVGGLGLLRGFDEDVFHTNAYAVTSLEVRYLLDRTSHLILLTDIGFLNLPVSDHPVLKIPVGMGLGGQIRTNGGIFRIIFAMGKQADQPFSVKNSKIHLGYLGVF